MAIRKFQDNLNIIGMLSDYPSSEDGLTTQEFKNLFDKAGLLIQQYINNTLIPQIESAIDEGALLQQISAAINRKLDKAGGLMTGNIDMNGQKITNLPAPVNDGDAATKEFTEAYSEKRAMRFHDVVVPASAFSSDTTDENFPFRASIPLKDVTDNMIPDVYFSFADAVSGMFAPVCAAYKGGVHIYASEQPTLGMTIPAIICRKEE
jgi:hypothetical protein